MGATLAEETVYEVKDRYRREQLGIVSNLAALAIHLFQGVAFAFIGQWVLVAVNVISVVIFAASAQLVRSGRVKLGGWLGGTEALIHVPALTIVLGPGAGYPFLFLLMVGNAALMLRRQDRTEFVLSAVIVVIEFAASLVVARLVGPLVVLEPGVLDALYYLNAGATLAGTLAMGVYFRMTEQMTLTEIQGLRRQVEEARQLGQYTLVAKLGEGGMGVVYRARHALLRRPTAVKLIQAENQGADALARFEREVQRTAQLRHPNTVTVYDYGHTADGVFYYAMELLDGETLARIVHMTGPQPPARVTHVLRQVAGALAEAHEAGLVHRDIKPANIMLCHQGGISDFAKVLDFGLVKELGDELDLTRPGTVAGTPLYLPPEAITAPGTVDARADVYALGCVAYYLLTGEHVFTGATVVEVCMHHVQTEPVPPSERLGRALPGDLEALVLECLHKQPAARPADGSALLRRLDRLRVERWDGSEWWEEYGHVVRSGPVEAAASPTALAVDLEQRLPPRSMPR